MRDPTLLLRSRLLVALGSIALFLLTFRSLQGLAIGAQRSPEHIDTPEPSPVIEGPQETTTQATQRTKRPGFAKVSMLYGDVKHTYGRAIETHIRHADRHGYPTYILRRELIDGVWNKLVWLIHVMVEEMNKGDLGARWVMWFDADSMVVNPALPLSIFLPPDEYPEIHFLGSKDQSGFNAGMFLIKIHSWSINILANAMTYMAHKPDVHLDYLEQTSLYYELNSTSNRDHVLYQPRQWINTYEFHHAYEGEKGDMFVHFPGLGTDRWNHMTKWLDILEGPGQAEWDVELAQTKYPAKIAEYWKIYGVAKEMLKDAKAKAGLVTDVPTSLKVAIERLEEVLWSETDQIAAMQAATDELMKQLGLAGLSSAVEAI